MKDILFDLYLLVTENVASFLAHVHKRRVVFCSFSGKAFGGDASCIALRLSECYEDLELIWATSRSDAMLPKGVKKCIIFNPGKSLLRQLWIVFHTFYLFASAHVLVFDSKGNRYRKNKKTLYLQTWHGDFPFKLIENECASQLPDKYLDLSKDDSKNIDIIVSASSMMSEIYANDFWLEKNCIITEFGVPRNDEFICANRRRANDARRLMKLSDDARLAVYAPTFRDDGDVVVYGKLDFIQLKRCLESKFGGNWKVLVRLHPNVSNAAVGINFCDDVINVTDIADGVGVFLASDLVITDASSVVRDFIAMDKPVFSFFPDFAHYASSCRSLRPLFSRLPIKRCSTTESLVAEIMSYDKRCYQDKMRDFLNSEGVKFFDHGRATENLCKIITTFVDSGKIVIPENAYRLVGDICRN